MHKKILAAFLQLSWRKRKKKSNKERCVLEECFGLEFLKQVWCIIFKQSIEGDCFMSCWNDEEKQVMKGFPVVSFAWLHNKLKIITKPHWNDIFSICGTVVLFHIGIFIFAYFRIYRDKGDYSLKNSVFFPLYMFLAWTGAYSS